MAKTSKGHIQQLPSGSFRVKVYAGTNPVTGKERLLRQTCPDEAAAHAALGGCSSRPTAAGSPTGMRLSARHSTSTWRSPTSRCRPERRTNYIVKQGNRIEKAPKDGEGRVLSLDLLTCELLRERFQRRRANAQALGVQVPEDAFAFSPDPVGRTPWNPDTMTHRYRRYARRVGIASSLKELRHYSATQLLAAGTDLNTVAGRLGHAEGSTTLRFYAQFTRPADQRAAAVIPSQLDGLRRKERLRELYRQHPSVSGADGLAALAAVMGAEAGLDEHTALSWLAEFASAAQNE